MDENRKTPDTVGRNKSGNGNGSRSYKRDVILVAVLLATALLIFFLVRSGQEAGAVAVVTVDGEEIGRYPLNRAGTFPLNGGSNTLVVGDGMAWVSEANCPDKVCMGMGKISRNGEFIACLPNRLIVVVEGGEPALSDAVT